MASKLLIRQAKEVDLPAILNIYADAMDGGQALTVSQAKAKFRRINSYPNYRLYVAAENKKVVGVFALLIMDNLAKRGTPSAIVEDVAVHPEWQGRGIGKKMMQFALKICRKEKCYKMALSSNLNRIAAHRFYESLGFKKHGYSFLASL